MPRQALTLYNSKAWYQIPRSIGIIIKIKIKIKIYSLQINLLQLFIVYLNYSLILQHLHVNLMIHLLALL